MQWLTKIFFSKGIDLIPEEKPLYPLWSTVCVQMWNKLNNVLILLHERYYNFTGFQIVICIGVAIFLVWKAEQHRYKDIDELLQLKRTQGN